MACSSRCLLGALALSACLWSSSHALFARPHARQLPETPVVFVLEGEGSHSGSLAMEWEAYTTDLWASLVLRNTPDKKGYDFNQSDAATKKTFITRCNQTFSIEVRSALPDEVVKTMCSRAGGTAAECKDLVLRLWKAYNESKVESWCNDTYKWFAARTLPKCAAKCTSYYCKERCSLHEKWKDLQDEAAAYQIKYNQYETALNRTLKESGLEAMKKDLTKYNASKCIPAVENVSSAKKSLGGINATWQGIEKKLPDLKKKRKAAYEAAKAARKEASESMALAEANKKKQDAEKALNKLKHEAIVVNTSLVETQSSLKEAASALEACKSKAGNLTSELKDQEAAVKAEAALLDGNKSKLTSLAEAVKTYNKTNCTPAVAEAALLRKKNGNLLKQEKQLQEDLAKAEHKYATAKDEYETELKRLNETKSKSASHMKAAEGFKTKLENLTKTAADQATAVEKFENGTTKPLAAKIEGKEKNLTEAEDAMKKAQLALNKAELKMKTAGSDLDAAKKLVKWDETDEAESHLKKAEANYTTAEKDYGEAKTALENSTKAVEELRKELPRLATSMKAAKTVLEEKQRKLASTQEQAESTEKKMNSSLASATAANGTIEELTNTSQEQLSQMNTTDDEIKKLNTSLSTNSEAQAEMNKAEKAADDALKELEKKVTERQNMELQIQDFEGALNRSKDAVKLTEKNIETTNEECKELSAEVDALTKNETKLSSELKGFTPSITKAQEDVVTAKKGVATEEKYLDGNITATQKTLNATTKAFAEALTESRKLNTRIVKLQGEITKAEGISEHYEKILKEMDEEYKKKEKSMTDELTKHRAKMANATGEIKRIRDLQKPMESAIGPMLKK